MALVTINFFGTGKHRTHHMRLRSFGPVSEQHLPEGLTGELMTAVLSDSQQVGVTYGNPVDKKGKPASVQTGSLTWKSSDATVATVTAGTESPIAGTIVAGNPGVCEVWPVADADLGDGVRAIEGEKIAVQVTAGEAVGLGPATVGTPVEQA